MKSPKPTTGLRPRRLRTFTAALLIGMVTAACGTTAVSLDETASDIAAQTDDLTGELGATLPAGSELMTLWASLRSEIAEVVAEVRDGVTPGDTALQSQLDDMEALVAAMRTEIVDAADELDGEATDMWNTFADDVEAFIANVRSELA